MDIADLRVFAAVVEQGGVTRAARHLHRVPSTVTARVLHLEDYLGVKLFLREGKSMRVTPPGRTLFGYARQVLDLVKEAEETVKCAAPSGKLRIGSMESTAAVRLPGPLAAFHAAYPEVALELKTASSRPLIAQLAAGELDAVFVADPPADERFARVTVFMETLVIAAPRGHPPIAGPKDLKTRTALVFAEGCSYRARLDEWFRSFGTIAENRVALSSYHAILGGVAAGMGIGIMPVSVLNAFPDRDAISEHPLSPAFGDSPTEFVWRKGMYSPTLDAFVKELKVEVP